MRAHAEEFNLMQQPRKNLISSYWARKSLFTTPLLKWFLDHGLLITRIYRVIEMKPKTCFADIRDEVIRHRRKADINPNHKSTAESWKTLGNSLYGKAMTNKEKHKICKVVSEEQVDKYMNSPRFNRMEPVGNQAYEVCMDKASIKLDLPITVSFLSTTTPSGECWSLFTIS